MRPVIPKQDQRMEQTALANGPGFSAATIPGPAHLTSLTFCKTKGEIKCPNLVPGPEGLVCVS